MKKILAVILSVVMLLSFSVSAFAYSIKQDDAQIGADQIFGTTAVYFEDAEVEVGESVTVELMLKDNDEITEIAVTLALPEGVTVEAVENGDLGAASYTGNVVTVTSAEAFVDDGCIAKITFKSSSEGEKKIILSATAENDGVAVNVNGSECVIVVTAPVAVAVPGDVNSDGKVDAADLATLKLFLAGSGEIDKAGADLDNDGDVNTSDLAALKLILATQ